jgi:hypothetical protein
MRAMRARRAAAVESGDDDRDPAELLGKDAGAAALAATYARVIDRARDPAWAARWIGPLLLQSLAELHATPASRKALEKQKAPARGPSRVAQLRQAHAVSTAKNKRAG